VCVQTFASELAVEAFYVAVILRFAGTNKIEDHPLMIRPRIEVTGYEVATAINSIRRWTADLATGALQGPDNIFTLLPKPGIQCVREA